MAAGDQAAGAHSAYDEPIGTGGNREDLSDLLWDVSPTETPGITAFGKNRATAITHDWLTDSLEDPAVNAHIEGSDAEPVAPASRVRLSNYTQIMKKWSVVTGTQEKVLKGGGIKSEMAYQVGRRMKAIKRDAELAIFGANTAKLAGSDVADRIMGSLSTYMGDDQGAVALPGSSYAGAADGTAPAGDGTDVPTKGTPRALDVDIFKLSLDQLWTQSGGNENIIALCGSYNRGVISGFTGAGTRYVTTDDKRLVDSLDVYDGDYHTVSIVPDRYSLPDAVFLLDSEYGKVSDLRPLHSYDLAKAGDSYRKEMTWEFTLEVCNPRAHIMIDALTIAA